MEPPIFFEDTLEKSDFFSDLSDQPKKVSEQTPDFFSDVFEETLQSKSSELVSPVEAEDVGIDFFAEDKAQTETPDFFAEPPTDKDSQKERRQKALDFAAQRGIIPKGGGVFIQPTGFDIIDNPQQRQAAEELTNHVNQNPTYAKLFKEGVSESTGNPGS